MLSAFGGATRTATSRLSEGPIPPYRVQNQKAPLTECFLLLEAPPGIGPGIKVLQTSALPLGYGAASVCSDGVFMKKSTAQYGFLFLRLCHGLPLLWSGLRGSNPPPPPWQGGALPNELNPQVPIFYNFSAGCRVCVETLINPSRDWCLRSESNQRHRDFQSLALPTELQRQIIATDAFAPVVGDPDGARTHDL